MTRYIAYVKISMQRSYGRIRLKIAHHEQSKCEGLFRVYIQFIVLIGRRKPSHVFKCHSYIIRVVEAPSHNLKVFMSNLDMVGREFRSCHIFTK